MCDCSDHPPERCPYMSKKTSDEKADKTKKKDAPKAIPGFLRAITGG